MFMVAHLSIDRARVMRHCALINQPVGELAAEANETLQAEPEPEGQKHDRNHDRQQREQQRQW
eukprot:13070164-Alexandrium_andersonii.AAC.1